MCGYVCGIKNKMERKKAQTISLSFVELFLSAKYEIEFIIRRVLIYLLQKRHDEIVNILKNELHWNVEEYTSWAGALVT